MDINVKGGTPLHIALQTGKSLETIQFILKYEADVNSKNNNGNTPIFVALSNSDNNLQIIRELLKRGASVKEINLSGDTALHIALKNRKSLEIIIDMELM